MSQIMKCVICGCSDSTPCPGGCAWLAYDPLVCTNCAYEAAEKGLVTQEDIDRYDFDSLIGDDDDEDEAEPLIVPVREYEAQRYIDKRRRAMNAGGGR